MDITWTKDECMGSFTARFDRVAERVPDHPAVIDASRTITYRELQGETRRIGAGIASLHGTEPVGLVMAHDAVTVAVIVGAIRATRIYVVLDPTGPADRNLGLIQDAGIRYLLADPASYSAACCFAGSEQTVVRIEELAGDERRLDTLRADGNTPAAIYYTSGSTGEPKGIVWCHRNLLHKACSMVLACELTHDDRHAVITPFTFGTSTAPMFNALLSGTSTTVYPAVKGSLEDLRQHLIDHHVTVLTPSVALFRSMLCHESRDPVAECVRVSIIGGDRYHPHDVDIWKRSFPRSAILFHGLSSTETNLIAMYRIDHDTPIDGAILPVGKPGPDKIVRILDPEGREVAPGEEGEIAVQSRYLCNGYWKRPALNAEKFRPALDGSGERMFMTGDIGRFDEDGNLYHLGRKDFMVKVRGFRVEIGEVEAALHRLEAIREAVVIAREDEKRESFLTAYVVFKQGSRLTVDEMRRQLGVSIPGHMIPTAFRVLDSLPRSTAEKVDRRALQTLAGDRLESEASRRPISTPTEVMLQRLWKSNLGREPTDVGDSFFNLGGTSISGLALLESIRRSTGRNLPLNQLYRSPTIEALARVIDGTGDDAEHVRYVILQSSGGGPPLFLVPGIGSDANSLRDVAAAFPPDRPLIGLQYPGVDGREAATSSLVELANRWADIVEKIFPVGPCLVGGTSGGGVAALELARELRTRGRAVHLVALIETNLPGRWLVPHGRGWTLRYHHRMMAWMPAGSRHWRWSDLGAGIAQHIGRMRAVRSARHRQARGDALPHVLRYHYLLDAAIRSLRDYKPACYTGRIVLFRAEQPEHAFATADPALGWSPYLSDLTIVDIPGRHGAHIRPPHASVLAQKLADACKDER